MGYTHYWSQKPIKLVHWSRIMREFNALKHSVPLADLAVTQDEIVFNGGCETFHLQRNITSDFEFCKTGRRPYDLIVCAALIIAQPYLISVSSDGDPSDWEPALKLVPPHIAVQFTIGTSNNV